MADKYINKDNNEVSFTTSSAGVSDAGKGVGLDPNGKLALSMMPVGVAPVAKSMPCSEDLSAGMFVNLYNSSGTLKCRKASNTDNTKPADGFVLAGYSSGDSAEVYFPGSINNSLSGLAIGTRYYLGTNGGVTATEPSASGNIIQELGKGLSASELAFVGSSFKTLA